MKYLPNQQNESICLHDGIILEWSSLSSTLYICCKRQHVYMSTSKAFLVLSCLQLGLQQFKLSLGFTLRKVV